MEKIELKRIGVYIMCLNSLFIIINKLLILIILKEVYGKIICMLM